MIYYEDIRACNQYAQASPENFKRCALFVLATVQQQLETVPAALSDICELGTASRFAWGYKIKGVEFVEKNYRGLYINAMRARGNPVHLMEIFLQVPGLALVKAGFLCQVFAGEVGCIDTHNVKLYNIPLSALRYRYEHSEKHRAACVERYVKLCEGLGGAHVLWSRWCDYVAALRPFNWTDGAEVSRFHLDVVNGTENGEIVDLFSDVEYEPTFRQA
jgi:hypothetical protein